MSLWRRSKRDAPAGDEPLPAVPLTAGLGATLTGARRLPTFSGAAKRLDRHLLAIAGVSWLAAGGMCFIALDALETARRSAIEIEAAKRRIPPVPSVNLTDIPPERLRSAIEGARASFPTLRIDQTPRGTVTVSATSARELRAWLGALRAIETGERLRWTILAMCVGTACRGAPLSAELRAQAVNIR